MQDNLKSVYFDNVNLYNLISLELEETYNLNYGVKDLKIIAESYINYCKDHKPVTLNFFINNIFSVE